VQSRQPPAWRFNITRPDVKSWSNVGEHGQSQMPSRVVFDSLHRDTDTTPVEDHASSARTGDRTSYEGTQVCKCVSCEEEKTSHANPRPVVHMQPISYYIQHLPHLHTYLLKHNCTTRTRHLSSTCVLQENHVCSIDNDSVHSTRLSNLLTLSHRTI
jgi:hypothetical protein